LPSLRPVVPSLVALHVVNAAVLLGLAGQIVRTAGQGVTASAPEELAMAGSRP
jgi:hypothetical protein